MTPILLSQFSRGPFLRLTIKGSKGLEKSIRIGADEYKSLTLSILLDPRKETEWFSLRSLKSGGLILTQNEKGNIRIKVSSDMSLSGQDTQPDGDYLKAEFNTSTFKKRNIKVVYLKLDTK